jgi:hypothetical protein
MAIFREAGGRFAMAIRPDNLTMCDIGDGREVPEELQCTDVLVLVFGDRSSFRDLAEPRDRLMDQIFGQPKVIMLALDLDDGSVSRDEEQEMEDRLEAYCVGHDLVVHVELHRDAWIRYYRKSRPPDA